MAGCRADVRRGVAQQSSRLPGHGVSRYELRQFDATAVVIKFLEKVKLAKNVKLPRPELVERRRGADKEVLAPATVAVAREMGD